MMPALRRASFLHAGMVIVGLGGLAGLASCEGLEVKPDAAPPDAAADTRVGPISITHVTWFHDSPCSVGSDDWVNIGVEVSGADPGSLTYSGGAVGCIGMVMSNPGRIECLEQGTHAATVTASDAAGHSDTKSFTILQCQPGSL